jgi:sulfur-carrier protein
MTLVSAAAWYHVRLALIRFTDNIQRHVACPPRCVDGDTLAAALHAYFSDNEKARGYVLDEQGSLRRHMAIFIDGRPIHDRVALSDHVAKDSTIDVMQALSGG